MKKFLRIIGILIVLIAAFFVIKTQTTRFGWTPTTTLANPASVYCEQQSGTLEIVTDASGGQAGVCHLADGTTCDEWAYFRGECPTTGTVAGNIFVYQSLGLSLQIPIGRTAKNDVASPCVDGSCNINVIRVTTDIKDNSGYNVYAFLKIDALDKNFKNAGKYIDSFDNEQNILVDQTEKKLIQLVGVSGYGSFVLKLKGEYFLIEIFDFTSEQPMPAGYDDIWIPYNVTEKDINSIINIIINIIKSITK